MSHVILSLNNDASKWLGVGDLPNLPSDVSPAGRVPLVTSDEQYSWQVNILKLAANTTQKLLIAVEAESKYTLLFPLDSAPSMEDFAEQFRRHFQASGVVSFGNLNKTTPSKLYSLAIQFSESITEFEFFRNNDARMRSHINYVMEYIDAAMMSNKISELSLSDAQTLIEALNSQEVAVKNSDGKTERFIAQARYAEQFNARFHNAELLQKIAKMPASSIPDVFKGQASEVENEHQEPVVNAKLGRNDPCKCGSGKKFKRCCL